MGINGRKVTLSVRTFEPPRWAVITGRLTAVIIAFVLFITIILPTISDHLAQRQYALTPQATSLLPPTYQELQNNISYNPTTQQFSFRNTQSSSQASGQVSSGSNMEQAIFPSDPSKGISITDPTNNMVLNVTPKFGLAAARQQTSHIYYPFLDGTGQLVYSPQASNVLEDIVLNKNTGNTMKFNYSIDLGDQYAARLQKDGSIYIYGSSLSSLGQISTDNAKDAALVQKMQKNAKKDTLLFYIPRPIITEANQHQSSVSARYKLLNGGKTIQLVATNLDKATYPLSIDPTVTVQSIAQLYRDTNVESNVDFNTSTGAINRGTVTGGVFASSTGWTTNANNLNTARFLHGTVVSNGYIYVAGGAGNNSTTNLSSMEYAQINTSNNSVGAWTTTTALPTALSQFRLLTYNGYLYAIGGSVTNTGCTSASTAVYYNATQPNGAVTSSWSTATGALPAGICNFGAAVYDNTIYVVGGQTGTTASTAVTTVYYASILPNGNISSWSTATSTPLPSAITGLDLQVYNGYLYAIGGENTSGTTLSTIYRAPLNSNGTIYGSSSATWLSIPNTFSTSDGSKGISSLGTSFSTVNDGYMYVGGGCFTITTNACTSVDSAMYISQINADGTLGPWSTIANSLNSNSVVGGSLTVFGGYLYYVAGCSSMNSGAVSCANGSTLNTQLYAKILGYGQIGPVTKLSGTYQVLPTGLYEASAVVNNGYLYVFGGCKSVSGTNGCQTGTNDTSSAIYYTALTDNGQIQNTGAWNTSAYTINGTNGYSAMGIAVYDNYVYLFGGYNYTADSNKIYYAKFSATGDLTGALTAYGTTLPVAYYSMSAVSDGQGHIYVIGGCSAGTHATGCSTYYGTATYAYNGALAVGASGPTSYTYGNATVANLPTAQITANSCTTRTGNATDCYPGTAAMGSAYFNGYVYLTGGASSANGGEGIIIEYGKITSSGTITSWTAASNFMVNPMRRMEDYAVNGYLYIIGGHNGHTNTTYNTVEIGAINLSTGDLSVSAPNGITSSASLLQSQEWEGSVVYADGTIYELGGCTAGNPPTTCTTAGTQVQVFQAYNASNDGTAAWSNATNTYGTNSIGASSLAYNGYVYTVGGCTSYTVSTGACSTINAYYSYAAINPDGSLGSWTNTAFANATAFGCLTQANGYLYYMGGQNSAGTAQSTVYYSLIGANGVPGTWTATTNALGTGLTKFGCDTFNGTIYAVGGYTSGSAYSTTVYYVRPIAGSGDITSAWSTFGTGFTNARAGLSAIVAGGYLYMIGGYNGATYYNDVQFIGLNPTTGASSGSWAYSYGIPTPTSFMTVSAANGYIFLSGGNTGTTSSSCSSTTYIASILSTGQLGIWTQGIDQFTTARMGASAAYSNGYMYVMGGDNCTSIISSSVIQYDGQQSQAMAGAFSRYADLNGDGLPEQFVAFVTNAQTNGVDIEDWKMAYQMQAIYTGASGWGVATTINPLTSGTVTNVYSYNSGGTNVQLARYIYLYFSIGLTKSFTFPDTTQPSVNSYYLYYSPAPANRLRNGKTFQDEQQQGFDLNY